MTETYTVHQTYRALNSADEVILVQVVLTTQSAPGRRLTLWSR